MTKEAFVKWLRPWLDDGIAFVAYWHPGGCGRLRTAPLPTERTRYVLHEPKKLRKGTLNKWRANVDWLRLKTVGEVITVEFDGRNTMIEGGELNL